MGCNKVIAFNVLYVLEKRKKSKISNLSFHLRKREKEKQYKPKASRRIEMKKIKIRAGINEIEARKQQQKSALVKTGSFKRSVTLIYI